MLHLSRNDLRNHTTAQLLVLLTQQDQSDEVWMGDAGDMVVGAATEFDEDGAETYVSKGAIAEYCESLRNLIEAR